MDCITSWFSILLLRSRLPGFRMHRRGGDTVVLPLLLAFPHLPRRKLADRCHGGRGWYSHCQLGDYMVPIPPIKGTRNKHWFYLPWNEWGKVLQLKNSGGLGKMIFFWAFRPIFQGQTLGFRDFTLWKTHWNCRKDSCILLQNDGKL